MNRLLSGQEAERLLEIEHALKRDENTLFSEQTALDLHAQGLVSIVGLRVAMTALGVSSLLCLREGVS